MSDAYAEFARRYDLFHGEFGRHDPEQVSFFQALFAVHDVHEILDCACGTGKHLHMFQALGFQVTGSDISPSIAGAGTQESGG